MHCGVLSRVMKRGAARLMPPGQGRTAEELAYTALLGVRGITLHWLSAWRLLILRLQGCVRMLNGELPSV